MIVRHRMREIFPTQDMLKYMPIGHYYICKKCRFVTTTRNPKSYSKGHVPYDGSYGYLDEDSEWMML